MKIRVYIDPRQLVLNGHEPIMDATIDVNLHALLTEDRELLSRYTDFSEMCARGFRGLSMWWMKITPLNSSNDTLLKTLLGALRDI